MTGREDGVRTDTEGKGEWTWVWRSYGTGRSHRGQGWTHPSSQSSLVTLGRVDRDVTSTENGVGGTGS